MAVALHVVNAALTRAGANPITALLAAEAIAGGGDLAVEQIVAGFNYEPVVGRCFSSSIWTFARQSVSLVFEPEGEAPPGRDLLFALPGSLPAPIVRIIAVQTPDSARPVDFDRIGLKFTTNARDGEELELLYIGRSPEAQWSADFEAYVIDELSPVFRMALADDPRSAAMFMDVAETRAPRVRTRDSQGQTPRRVISGAFRRAKVI